MMIVMLKKAKKYPSHYLHPPFFSALNPSFLAIDPSLVEKKLQGTEV